MEGILVQGQDGLGVFIPSPQYRKSEISVLWSRSNRPPELVPCTMPFLGYLGCITGLLRSFPAQHRAGGNTPTWPGCEEVFKVWEKTGRGLLGIIIKTRSICLWLWGFWVGLCLSHLMSFDHGMSREKPPNLTGDVELFFSSTEDASVLLPVLHIFACFGFLLILFSQMNPASCLPRENIYSFYNKMKD